MSTNMIFISHSSKDEREVMQWCHFIEMTGMKCWISERDLDQGRESWADELMNALRISDKILLYLSKNAIESGEVENEIATASAMRKNIIPLIPEEIKIPPKIEYLIRKYEWINAYKLEHKSIEEMLRRRLAENNNEEREKFLKITQLPKYKKFVAEVLKKYYGEEYFMKINGIEFPIFSVKGKTVQGVTSIKDFDILCDLENSDIYEFNIEDHQEYTQYKWYNEYSMILEGKIKYPDRPGYMLDELELNPDGEVEKIRVYVGTYAENVYSTHVLEYELYRTFLEFGEEDLNDLVVWDKLCKSMEIRNRIHGDAGKWGTLEFSEGMYKSLLSGSGRDSLLSVQMLVVVKSKQTKEYEVKIIQRSQQVAVAPGVYQFVPAGGFEILNDSEDNIYDELELEENFSPGCAVFREYLEELFNVPEFEGRGSGSIEDRLLKDPRMIVIEDMLLSGRASLQFLGSVMDLAGLRHELSFVLVIHDEEYSMNRFLANEECKKGKVNNIPVKNFEAKKVIWNQIHGPSAAMWELFKQTDIYQKIITS